MIKMKVSIIGVGLVGSQLAYSLMKNNNIEKIFLVEKIKERVEGVYLDIVSAFPSVYKKIEISDFENARNADVIVITAGHKRTNEKKRSELLEHNKLIMKSIFDKLKPENSIVIIVTNPVDLLTAYVLKITEYNPKKIFGFGGSLDNNRLKYILSKENMKTESYVVGEHGDVMIPVYDGEDKEKITNELRNYGSEIISRIGYTVFGPAECLSELIDNIANDSKKTFSISHYNENYNACITWPCVIGRNGIEKILDIELEDKEEFEKFIEKTKKIQDEL